MAKVNGTGYYGIYVQVDVNGYWLVTSNGTDRYFTTYPTDADVNAFVATVRG